MNGYRRVLGGLAGLSLLGLFGLVLPAPRPALAMVWEGVDGLLQVLPPPRAEGWQPALLDGRQLRYRVRHERDRDPAQAVRDWVEALPPLGPDPGWEEDLARSLGARHPQWAARLRAGLPALAQVLRRRTLYLDLGSVVLAARVDGAHLRDAEDRERWRRALAEREPAWVGPARAVVALEEADGATLVEVERLPARGQPGETLLPGPLLLDFVQAPPTAYRLSCTRSSEVTTYLEDHGWKEEEGGWYRKDGMELVLLRTSSPAGTVSCAAARPIGEEGP